MAPQRIFILTFLFLSGCASANLVQKNYEPVKSGIVKYKNSVINGTRSAEKAQEIMADFCSPSFPKVIQEQASLETLYYQANSSGYVSGNSYSGSTTVTPVNAHYVYVQFRCDARRVPASIDYSGIGRDEGKPSEQTEETRQYNACIDNCTLNVQPNKNSCYDSCNGK